MSSNSVQSLKPIPLESLIEHELGRQRQIFRRTAPAHSYNVLPTFDDPACYPVLPIRHRVLVELQRDSLALPWCEVVHFGEGFEHEWDVREFEGRREGNVELDDVRARDGTSVGDRD